MKNNNTFLLLESLACNASFMQLYLHYITLLYICNLNMFIKGFMSMLEERLCNRTCILKQKENIFNLEMQCSSLSSKFAFYKIDFFWRKLKEKNYFFFHRLPLS